MYVLLRIIAALGIASFIRVTKPHKNQNEYFEARILLPSEELVNNLIPCTRISILHYISFKNYIKIMYQDQEKISIVISFFIKHNIVSQKINLEIEIPMKNKTLKDSRFNKKTLRKKSFHLKIKKNCVRSQYVCRNSKVSWN